MKSSMRVMGRLSVVLLICVLLGQGVWLYRVREMKVDEFRKTTDYVLRDIMQVFLDNQAPFAIKKLKLTYFLSNENEFCWKYNDTEKKLIINSLDEYNILGRQVVYDCLYENQCMNIQTIVILYTKALRNKGISEIPHIMIKSIEGRDILGTEKITLESNSINTIPINLGYDYKHQLVASFELPFIFRALKGVLWVESLFMVGFIICLLWQWDSIRKTVRGIRIQTMGMAHLEHELKKPLATMISAVEGILNRKESDLCSLDETKLGFVKARLIKMADIIDTMLTSLKTSMLKIEREKIDLRMEMEMVIDMFAMIRKQARVTYRIAEGVEYPNLDKVCFNHILVNLVDNAIKYGKDKPEVEICFFAEGDFYILTVQDNGIGIAPKDQKHIFKRFYRVKDPRVGKTTGFGLGLAFVRKVVCAYHGKIRLESELEKGSRFIIILPQE